MLSSTAFQWHSTKIINEYQEQNIHQWMPPFESQIENRTTSDAKVWSREDRVILVQNVKMAHANVA